MAPAPYHYRCVTRYVPSKHREIVSDTIKIIPNYVPIPQTNIDDYIREKLLAILQLQQARKPHITPIPTLQSQSAMVQTAEILHNNSPAVHNNKNRLINPPLPTSEGEK